MHMDVRGSHVVSYRRLPVVTTLHLDHAMQFLFLVALPGRPQRRRETFALKRSIQSVLRCSIQILAEHKGPAKIELFLRGPYQVLSFEMGRAFLDADDVADLEAVVLIVARGTSSTRRTIFCRAGCMDITLRPSRRRSCRSCRTHHACQNAFRHRLLSLEPARAPSGEQSVLMRCDVLAHFLDPRGLFQAGRWRPGSAG